MQKDIENLTRHEHLKNFIKRELARKSLDRSKITWLTLKCKIGISPTVRGSFLLPSLNSGKTSAIKTQV